MVGIVHRVNSHVIKMTMPMKPAQTAFAHLCLDREEIFSIKIKCGMKLGLLIFAGGKNSVSNQNKVMDVGIEIAAEPVDKGNGPEPGTGRSVRTGLPNCGLHRPQENPEQAADNFRLT